MTASDRYRLLSMYAPDPRCQEQLREERLDASPEAKPLGLLQSMEYAGCVQHRDIDLDDHGVPRKRLYYVCRVPGPGNRTTSAWFFLALHELFLQCSALEIGVRVGPDASESPFGLCFELDT